MGSNRFAVLALAVGLLLAGVAPTAVAQPANPGDSKTGQAVKVYALFRITEQPRVLEDPERGRESDRAYERFKRTQGVLIKTRLVARAALRDAKVAELDLVKQQKDSVAWLSENLQVDFPNDSEIMRVWLPGKPSKELASLLNALADAYLREIVNKERIEQSKRLDMLRGTLVQYDNMLRNKRSALRPLAEQAGSNDSQKLALMQKLALDQLDAVRKELLQVNSELRKTKSEIAAEEAKQKNAAERAIPEQVMGEMLASDLSVKKMEAILADREMKLASSMKTFGPNDVTTKAAEKEFAKQQQELADLRNRLRTRFAAAIREKLKAEAQARQLAAEERLAVVEGMQKLLREEARSLSDEIKQVTVTQVDLESFKEEIAQAEAIARKVQTEVERMRVEINAPARIQLIERAEAPAD
jgi:hypothetical protein